MNGHDSSTQRTGSRTADSDGSLLAGLPDDLIAYLSRNDDAEDDAPGGAARAEAPTPEAAPAPAAPAQRRAPDPVPDAERPRRSAPEKDAKAKPNGPRIDVQASISADDLVAFNQVWGQVSGERSRVLWGARAWALVPIVGGVVMLFFRDWILGSALIALGGVLAIAAGPYYKAAVRRAVRRQLAGQNPAMMGPRRIVIDQTGVFEGGRYDRLQIGWPGVIDLVLGHEALYVFYGTMQAVILPRRAFRSGGDFERMAHTVERLYGRRATVVRGR